MNLSGWVLSIAGMIVMTVIVDIIIPKGQTSKIIKGVFAFITVLVIASPLPKLLNSQIDLSTYFKNNDATASYSLALSNSIYQMRLEQLKISVSHALESNGVTNAEVTVYAQNSQSFVETKKIKVNLKKAVIKVVDGNILDLEDIQNIVASAANVDKETVEIYDD